MHISKSDRFEILVLHCRGPQMQGQETTRSRHAICCRRILLENCTAKVIYNAMVAEVTNTVIDCTTCDLSLICLPNQSGNNCNACGRSTVGAQLPSPRTRGV